MKGKKNDYSMTFYNGEERVMFLKFVHNTKSAEQWMKKLGKEWTHAMLYDRRKEISLGRYYPTI